MRVEEAYRHCESVVGEHARNFKYSFAFLPAAKKRAMAALYAFCRHCDDVSDGPAPVAEKMRALADVRRLLRDCLAGRFEGPLWTALADATRRFPIPLQTFEYIIEGVEQDLTVTRYAVFGELKDYCFRVASAVGLACLEIFEYTDKAALGYGIDLGIAMQLTNIIRDVGEDAERGRIYLPQEELRQFGVVESDILGGRYSPNFPELMRFQAARARDYFDRARPLPGLLPRHSRSCPMALASVYQELLGEMERGGFRVLDRRARVSGPHKAFLALGTLIRSWL
jgi:phytoene synthase